MDSAWERMTALRAQSASSNRVRVSPTETLDLRIFCGTWNVAGRVLDPEDDIGQWLDVDLLDEEGEKGQPPDIFVVGFQEVVELSAQNVVMDSFLDTQSRANSLKWFTLVYAYLAQYGQRYGIKYTMLSEQRLLGTYLLVMAAETLCPRIRHVQSVAVPTGLGGILGNKGAVALRMEVAGSSSLCFVCAHMAAHRENVLARNAEYKFIASKPVFADTSGRLATGRSAAVDTLAAAERRQGGAWGGLFGTGGQWPGGNAGGLSPTRNSEMKKAIRAAMAFGLPRGGGGGKAAGGVSRGDEGSNGSQSQSGRAAANGVESSEDAVSSSKQQEADGVAWMPSEEGIADGLPKTKTVLQADIVFWLGDLNYRITEEVPDEEVFELLGKDELEALRNMDQLNRARATGAAFQEFQEGPLCFAPTYKYIPGTKEFDTRPEKKVRCPSWTDRVLYSVGMYGGDAVRRLALDRYWSSGPLLSDHIPVSALFRTSLTCAPEDKIEEPEIEAEPLSPTRAAAAAAFDSAPFPRVTLEPPALVFTLNGASSSPSCMVVEVRNTGGVAGEFHVCTDSVPSWISFGGDGGEALKPGETTELRVMVDATAVEAEGASGVERYVDGQAHRRPAACAVLRVEVDGGGSGMLLPVVCSLANR